MSNPFHGESDNSGADGEKMLVYVCEHCGERFEAAESDMPRAVDCPHCGVETILDAPRAEPEPTPQPEEVTVEQPAPTEGARADREHRMPVTVNVVSAPSNPEPPKLPPPRLEPGGALVECPDCGGVLSRRAAACPVCGRPRKARHGVFYHVFMGTLSFTLSLAFLWGAAYLLAGRFFPDQQARLTAWLADSAPGAEFRPAAPTAGDPGSTRTPAPRPQEAGDDAEARAQFEDILEKARAGDAEAQQYVGYCYYVGHGAKQDDHEAFSWYFKAALQDSPVAQSHLASMFVEGRGVPQDYNEALRYFKKAAEKGLPEAQFNLGVLYDKGLGVTQNYKEAFRWYYQAASGGDVNAQLSVAMMHFQGQGANLNLVQALKWAILASSQGNKGAEELRRALTESDRALMPEQIAQAQREASEFMEEMKKKENADAPKG